MADSVSLASTASGLAQGSHAGHEPVEQEFIVDPPVHRIILSATSEAISGSDRVQVGIRAEVLDRDGEKVLDGTVVHFAVVAVRFCLKKCERDTNSFLAFFGSVRIKETITFNELNRK